ncbi:ketoacyl-ACP synthase III [Pedobacter sp. HDW13]|uniref:3-oxoacyl-ACP synthase III family protein n=1 Tax=Pedobacter sp. HDW13 TaxID=2714940 RepID=UPI0014078D94|nr:ketoacyl-ACP synthase III [Pedobacter sp. HDW13]QIL39196.1 ketoacyl-ACP synthase III [Pedobacter sp. HDW13]
MEAHIKAISYFLPEQKLDNKKLNSLFPEWSVDKISAKTGIFERRITNEQTFSSDLGVKAAEKLFSEHDISPLEIDYILFCTQSPDYFLPTTACLVQDRLGIPTSAGALDYNLGCSGFVYGLGLAKGLILAEEATNVLLITAETYSKFIHPNDKSNRTIFGDAAAATLISNEPGIAKIGKSNVGTDGKGAENLIVKNGGLRNRQQNDREALTDEYGNTHHDDFLFMNGSEIFNFTSEMVPALVETTLKRNKLDTEDIDLYIFHQANKFMLNHLRKKIKIDENKFYYFLENCGNTVSSTIPIALYHAILDKRAKGNVLLAGFGVGYSWGGLILEFVPN